jgi:hypothetical protein
MANISKATIQQTVNVIVCCDMALGVKDENYKFLCITTSPNHVQVAGKPHTWHWMQYHAITMHALFLAPCCANRISQSAKRRF